MLSVVNQYFMLSVVMANVVILSVVVLSIAVPCEIASQCSNALAYFDEK